MFICDYCTKPIGPKIKPYMVVVPGEMRPRTYENFNADGDLIVTHGTEITAEYKQCPQCAPKP